MISTVLIADDDPVQRRLLEVMVRRFGYRTETVESGEAVLARLNASEGPNVAPNVGDGVDLLLLDLVMPDLDGMGVLERMRARQIETPVIVQTSPGSIEAVISAIRAGAFDFVVKPVGGERLQASIKNALRFGALEGEIRRMGRKAAGQLTFKDIFSRGEGMAKALRLGERAARSSIPVLIEGEAGVGKQLLARAIHGASDRRGKPFVTAHCGAQPPALIEAVLFGQEKEKEKEKGAIGAAPDKLAGKFAEAHGGTLFLDGIDELPLEAQVKLLRALQDGEIEPVGARKPARVDVRIVAATGRNLIERVKQGRFREDLYYRLNVFPISMPPLRARRADIADLARRFLARFSAEEGKRVRGLTAESLALLSSYDWPGNVRQLENAIFRAVVLAEGDELTVAEFPQIAAQVEGFDVRIPSAPPPVGLRETQREIVRVEVRDPNVLRLLDENGDVRRLDRLEEEAIRFALSHYRGRMSEMARKLGIGRSTLYRKMKDYGLAEGDDVNAA